MLIIIVNIKLGFMCHFHVSPFYAFMIMFMLFLSNIHVTISYLYHHYVDTCIVVL